MNISYNWLNEFIDNPLSPDETAEKLTLIGLEVEEIKTIGSSLEGVVVGEVLETKQHPNADRLKVCQVDLGSETVQIVCGASNVAASQKVAVATVGSTLPIPLENGEFLSIKKAKLRGETSEGMICAEDELGLGDDHEGILVLDNELSVGTPFNEVVETYTDTIIEIAITPNRPDATCHLGVARDLSAALDLQLRHPYQELPLKLMDDPSDSTNGTEVSISIASPEKCNRYAGQLIKGVQIGESPDWLKRRISAIGLRPVNNVVDITNYVMYELGQPLHAFDFDLLSEGSIIVQDFDEPVEFETLDHIKRTCAPGTLFICDSQKPVAIAGVMGGLYSEVSDATTNILLESAYFDPGTIRKAAKAQQLQTDASYRFERGIDPELQALAALRATQLITEIAGGKAVGSLTDVHPVQHPTLSLTLTKSYTNRLLGTSFSISEIVRILSGLELKENTRTEEEIVYEIPSFRPDLTREVDLIEEVGRLYDYNRIPKPEHGIFVSSEPVNSWEQLKSSIRNIGVELGFREIYTNSLISEEEAALFGEPESMIPTLNPLNSEMSTLRPNLLHGFLKAAAYNANRLAKSVRFFEVGNVFHSSKRNPYHEGIGEETSVLFGLSGARYTEQWLTPPAMYSAFDLKQEVDAFLIKLGFTSGIKTRLLEDGTLEYTFKKMALGSIQAVSPELQQSYSLNQPCFTTEFSLNALADALNKMPEKKFVPIPKFPPFEFDFAVLVDKDIQAGKLLDQIKANAGNQLMSVDVFDVFEGDSIGADQKSLAFRLNFLDPNKTLNIKEVEPIINRIVKVLEQRFSAKLRG
ncbi:MAG: phenylalanine--tRNA ligase subunit beta [Bacteroidota bacterium]